jgi:hypothetical protein
LISPSAVFAVYMLYVPTAPAVTDTIVALLVCVSRRWVLLDIDASAICAGFWNNLNLGIIIIIIIIISSSSSSSSSSSFRLYARYLQLHTRNKKKTCVWCM